MRGEKPLIHPKSRSNSPKSIAAKAYGNGRPTRTIYLVLIPPERTLRASTNDRVSSAPRQSIRLTTIRNRK
jgi:hypothetical protein